MQSGSVYRNDIYIGEISRSGNGMYRFAYSGAYLGEKNAVPISVNLPLRPEPFISENLFPFFFNMLAEGNIKALQCRELKIDEDDHFTRLLQTTSYNTIGSITIKENRTDRSPRTLGRGPGDLPAEIEAAYETERKEGSDV